MVEVCRSARARGFGRASVLAGVIGALSGAVSDTQAQQQSQMMVVDDGGGAMVMRLTGPDLRALREPDFVRADLRVFDDVLALDDAQHDAVASTLDAYLASFAALVKAKLPGGGERDDALAVVLDGEDDPGLMIAAGGEGDAIGELMREAMKGQDGDLDVDLEEGAEIGGAVSISIGVGGPGGGMTEDVEVGPGGEGDADVAIAIETPEGVEIPPEVLEALQARAREMAENIQAQMKERMAAGGPALEDEGAAMARMDARQARLDEIAKEAKAFERQKETLRHQFVADVRGALEPEQLERWPRVERTLTRQKTLPRGRLDGERTDLVALLDDLELDDDDRTALVELRESYERELHEALVRRNDYLIDAEALVDEAIAEGKPDRALDVIDRAADLRVAVRGVNMRYAEQMAVALDHAEGEALRQRFQRVSFPRVYRQTRAQKAFDAIRTLPDLEEETLVAIADLEAAYAQELVLANARLRRDIEKHQPKEPRREIERVRDVMQGVEAGDEAFGPAVRIGGPDPVRAAFARRGKLDERYVKYLRDLLPPERAATLPALAPRTPREPVIIREFTTGGDEAMR